ncbi:MAG: methyltransferase domain-containing protein [Gaiellaceae bacterium]
MSIGMTSWDDPAQWYEVMNPWGPSDDFYLALVMGSASVLDVGCGTGMLLRRARAAGHTGRLCGLDRDPAMLGQAQAHPGIEWVLTEAASAAWDREFQLAVMTGHAFQQLIDDDEIHRSLHAVRGALVEGGRFVFETRNPEVRAWERWNTSYEVRNPDGEPVRVTYRIHAVEGDVLRLSETLSGRWWNDDQVSKGALRFLASDALLRFLEAADFTVEAQFGDWDQSPLTAASEEIITIACR